MYRGYHTLQYQGNNITTIPLPLPLTCTFNLVHLSPGPSSSRGNLGEYGKLLEAKLC